MRHNDSNKRLRKPEGDFHSLMHKNYNENLTFVSLSNGTEMKKRLEMQQRHTHSNQHLNP